MRPKFKKPQYGAVVDKFYSVDIILKKKERWVHKEWCVNCRRKTKYQLLINKWLDKGLWATKYVWCCGPNCMEKELDIVKSEVLEAITR